MGRLLVPLAALALLAVPASAAPPAVPLAAQARLVRAHPTLAAVPTRLPLRTSFVGWRYDPAVATVVERFRDTRFPGDPARILTVTIRRFQGDCGAGRARTLQMGGNRVFVDAAGTTVWRCLAGPQVKVVVTSGGYLPDVGLGRVAASVQRLR